MARLEVRELGKDELQLWDTLVAGSDQGTVFHTSNWLFKNASLLNQVLILLGCYEGEKLVGGCPLFLSNRSSILRLAFSTPRLTPYGGVIASGMGSAKQRRKDMHIWDITLSIQEYIAQKRLEYVNLVNAPGLTDIRAFTQSGWSPEVYYTYILPLDNDILKDAAKDVRQNIRKAQKQGIYSTVKFDPDVFWDLTVRTFAKQGRKPLSSRAHLVGLLEMIHQQGIGEMRIANTPSGETVAADVTVWDTKMAHSWAAAASPEHLNTGASTLLCYDLFNSLRERNHKSINMMAGNTPQLSTFISSFNPQLVPYYGVGYSRLKLNLAKMLLQRP